MWCYIYFTTMIKKQKTNSIQGPNIKYSSSENPRPSVVSARLGGQDDASAPFTSDSPGSSTQGCSLLSPLLMQLSLWCLVPAPARVVGRAQTQVPRAFPWQLDMPLPASHWNTMQASPRRWAQGISYLNLWKRCLEEKVAAGNGGGGSL